MLYASNKIRSLFVLVLRLLSHVLNKHSLFTYMHVIFLLSVRTEEGAAGIDQLDHTTST